MATESSTSASNAVANPRVVSENTGVLRSTVDTIEVSDGANGDVAILKVKVPVTAKIRAVVLAADDLVGDATASIGFYKQDNPPMGTTYTEVDLDAIANEIDVNDAAVAPTDYRFSVKNISTINAPAYELAGLSAKPTYGEFFVAVTFETDTEAAGTVSLRVDFVE